MTPFWISNTDLSLICEVNYYAFLLLYFEKYNLVCDITEIRKVCAIFMTKNGLLHQRCILISNKLYPDLTDERPLVFWESFYAEWCTVCKWLNYEVFIVFNMYYTGLFSFLYDSNNISRSKVYSNENVSDVIVRAQL